MIKVHYQHPQATGIAKVGGGVRLGNLGVGIFKQGHAALPHGTFPGVGIGGHYTHGGFGYSSRKWGKLNVVLLSRNL
jgi:FAD/FMN-containing dehydrogenase